MSCEITKQDKELYKQMLASIPADVAAKLQNPSGGRRGRHVGGATWTQHAIALMLMGGAMGMSGAAVWVMYYSPLAREMGVLQPCSTGISQLGGWLATLTGSGTSCAARQAALDNTINRMTALGLTTGVFSYPTVLKWVEANYPGVCKAGDGVAAVAAPSAVAAPVAAVPVAEPEAAPPRPASRWPRRTTRGSAAANAAAEEQAGGRRKTRKNRKTRKTRTHRKNGCSRRRT